MTTVVRRLLGTLAILLFVGGAKVLFDVVAAPPSGSIEVVAHVGRAGQGLGEGSDVKVRGVNVGTVKEVTLDDNANAVATLIIHPVHRLPKDVEALVVAKTFLGEKQIVLRPKGESLSEGPALADGDVLGVAGGGQPTEVQELIAALEPLLDEIGPFDLAAIVDTFGSFDRQDAETAAKNIEVGAELADFGAETAAEQIDRLSTLADVTGELATTADDFNRLNRSLPEWVSLLPDRQRDVRRNLDALAAFSRTTADFLQTEEQAITEVLRVTTIVNGVVAGQAGDLSRFIEGAFLYAKKLGAHGGSLVDGSEHGWFTVMMGDEGTIGQICESLGPLEEHAPGCVEDEGEDPGAAGGSRDGGEGR